MVRLMKRFNRLMMGSLILIISLSLFPSFLAIYGLPLNKKPLMKESDWIPPKPDNLYYTEDLDVNILKDGSVEKQWSLVDHGIGNITFLINLTTPVNLSSIALEDLRVRLAITQHDNYPHAWGPFIYRGSTEFMFEDEFESIVSHIFLEFYALIDDAGNQSLIFSLLDNCTAEFESLWEGVTFFKFDQSVRPGTAGRRISQTWRAFPSNDLLETVIEYLLDNCLPTNIGLFRVEKNNFVNSEHKSIHIAANWDGYNESGSEDYYREPTWLPGTTEDLDDRWEYIAGIYEYDSEAIQIEKNSENTLYFIDIIPFTENLPSHPKANSSDIEVNLYHGSRIVAADPNFLSSPQYRARYTLDMLSDSGEGPNYELPDDSYINFNDGMDEVPALTVKVSIDKQIIPFGENFTITYNVTNNGASTAYDVELEDDFRGLLPANFTIFQGDSEPDGDVDASWSKIEPGDSETHIAKIHCNGSGQYYTNPELTEYHASTYADINEWNRNPNDYSGGYEIDGQEVVIVCNDTAAILNLDVSFPKTSFTVGEKVNVNMTITNVGDENATNIFWNSPIIGINTTRVGGYIETIIPNEFVDINTSFIIDHPSRFMGGFIELGVGLYRGASVSYWYSNGTRFSMLDANEIPLNIFPQTDQEYGSLVVLQKELSQVTMDGKDYLQVTIHVKNSGDTTAYNVDVDDIYPMENFTIISGSPSETWAYLPPGVEFTYSYIVKYPEGISSDTQVSYLTATYDYSYLWYGGSSWEGSFAFSAQAAGFVIGDIFGVLLVLGFMSATTVAVILGVILLRKRGL